MNIFPFTSFSRFLSSSWLSVSVEACTTMVLLLLRLLFYIWPQYRSLFCVQLGVPFNLIFYTINVLWSQTDAIRVSVRLRLHAFLFPFLFSFQQFQRSLNFSSDHTAPHSATNERERKKLQLDFIVP